jgi:hypothetical protein
MYIYGSRAHASMYMLMDTNICRERFQPFFSPGWKK